MPTKPAVLGRYAGALTKKLAKAARLEVSTAKLTSCGVDEDLSDQLSVVEFFSSFA